MGSLSIAYDWGLVESEDIFPMKITPLENHLAEHLNTGMRKKTCVDAE